MGAVALILVLNLLLWNGKTTYTIRDGHRVLIHTTSRDEPAEILEEAGIELAAGDRVDTYQTEDGPMLQVLRQQHLTVDHYGTLVETTSYGETVAQLLQRLGLEVGEGDTVSLSPEQATYDGLVLKIYREIRQEQTYTVTMPLETVYCADPMLPVGTHLVLIQGRNGELLRRAMVTYINGAEVSRQILSEEVVIQPVTGVIAIGTGRTEPEEQCFPIIGDGLIRLANGEVLSYSRVISSLATAYCDKGLTATGTQARVGAIAVDPAYIPYGTRMFILSKDGEYIYGIATAEDCGSKDHIYGTRIDLHYDTREECIQFGARMCWVYILC